jgi:hypothetical protein
MDAAVIHVCYPLHRILVVNANGGRQSFIPTAIELTVLLTALKCGGRLPLKKFVRVPILPPPNLALKSGEICLINNY